MKVSASQIRAARALLGWTQTNLAEQSDVGIQTIKNIENERNSPQIDTYQRIIFALERAGITFLPDDGVKRNVSSVVTLHGKEGFAQFRQDVLEDAKSGNLDMCVSNVDERLFDKWGAGDVNDNYRAEMAKIVAKNPDMRSRFLIKEQDKHIPAKGHAEYRWIPDSEFGDFPLYIYGNKTATLVFEENDLHIFTVSHPIVTNFYRKQFNEKWGFGQRAIACQTKRQISVFHLIHKICLLAVNIPIWGAGGFLPPIFQATR